MNFELKNFFSLLLLIFFLFSHLLLFLLILAILSSSDTEAQNAAQFSARELLAKCYVRARRVKLLTTAELRWEESDNSRSLQIRRK